jgi:hypothetical protein
VVERILSIPIQDILGFYDMLFDIGSDDSTARPDDFLDEIEQLPNGINPQDPDVVAIKMKHLGLVLGIEIEEIDVPLATIIPFKAKQANIVNISGKGRSPKIIKRKNGSNLGQVTNLRQRR